MKSNSPTIIGGAGGSGTRLIAQILIDMGYYLGGNLNESMDNLWFMYLFKRTEALYLSDQEFQETLGVLISVMLKKGKLSSTQVELVKSIAKEERSFYSKRGFKILENSLLNNENKQDSGQWGWKEPNSHFYIQQLRNSLPNMKYIHVIRNGLDMAFSDNQNQLILWGSHFINDMLEINPKTSLKFWCMIHKKLFSFSKTMKQDFYLLNFDEFCNNPKNGIKSLCDFLNTKLNTHQEQKILSLVKPLKSLGRYKKHDLSIFDEEDLAYVNQLGFEIY